MPKVIVVEGQNDLASQRPDIASEWHPEKNGTVKPTAVFVRSSQMSWWRCALGHEWEAKVVDRQVSGCPFCSNRRILPGYNDLASEAPELARDWNLNRNEGLLPTQITAGSSKRVWWICEKGHEWQTTPANRSGLGTGCPFCSGMKRIEGENDLKATHPKIAAEWNYERNKGLNPSHIGAASNKKVWWTCDEGHEFERVVSVRTMQGINDCPFCKSRKAFEGLNDLATTHPDLAKEWHPIKNKSLKPTQITHRNSRTSIWWMCDKGHEWEAVARNRTIGGTGCPYCVRKKAIPGKNDLASLHPELLLQWNKEKNTAVSPSQLLPGSGKRVWWICSRGHEWKASVGGRAQRNSGCPYCAGVMVLSGFNDLETSNPSLAEEWNFKKNHPLEPKDVSGGNHHKAWWICGFGHEWEAVISSRNSGIGCPICAGKKVLPGFNDFETVYPQLAEEWDYKKNDITPQQVSSSSGKLIWWKCRLEGHSWRTSPSHRGKGGRGCPSCSKGGYDPNKPGLLYFLHNEGLKAKKIGITNQNIKTTRLQLFQKAGWSILRTWEREDGYLVFDTETITLRWLRRDLGLPPYLGKTDMGNMGGWSETFFEDGVADSEVIRKVEEVIGGLSTEEA